MAYTKPWKSHDDQLNLLISRGMSVTDRAKAIEHLARIGYYRLSGYWFPFRTRSGPLVLLDRGGRPPNPQKEDTIALDQFRPDTRFEDAVALYVFDKRLRLLVTDALERIEIALRVDISHTLGELDPFAYTVPQLLHWKFCSRNSNGVVQHQDWITKHEKLIADSKEEFVRHNRERYGLPLAIWVACEVWDFGTMSRLYAGMRESEQERISAKYGISNGRVFASWLRSLNYLRNVCAHHSRLWNRNIVDQPRLPSANEVAWVQPFAADAQMKARCFLILRIVRHLLRVVHPNSSWPDRMRTHLENFPALGHLGVDVSGMGVPADWTNHW